MEYPASENASEAAEEARKTLGTRLRKSRELRRMPQTRLARRMRTSPSQVSMIESGRCGTSIRSLVAAASTLNVSLDFLAGLSDDPRPTQELVGALRENRASTRDLESRLETPPANKRCTPLTAR